MDLTGKFRQLVEQQPFDQFQTTRDRDAAKWISQHGGAAIALVGDSIAFGISSQLNQGVVADAAKGLTSTAVLGRVKANVKLKNATTAVISVGSNDIVGGRGNAAMLTANAQKIRNELNAKQYIWIVPYDSVAADAIDKAKGAGDQLIALKDFSTNDGVHPGSYTAVANAIRTITKKSAPATAPTAAADTGKEPTPAPAGGAAQPQSQTQPEDLETLQKALMAAGFDLPKYGADGKMGPETKQAILRAEQQLGRSPTGSITTQELAKLKGTTATTPAPTSSVATDAVLTRPGDKGKYKIVSSKPWSNNPSVTVVLNSRINADGTTSYTVRGIDVGKNLTYEIPTGTTNTSDDLNTMKGIFDRDLKLDGPYEITNPNTIQGMLRNALMGGSTAAPAPAAAKPMDADKLAKLTQSIANMEQALSRIKKENIQQDPVSEMAQWRNIVEADDIYIPPASGGGARSPETQASMKAAASGGNTSTGGSSKSTPGRLKRLGQNLAKRVVGAGGGAAGAAKTAGKLGLRAIPYLTVPMLAYDLYGAWRDTVEEDELALDNEVRAVVERELETIMTIADDPEAMGTIPKELRDRIEKIKQQLENP
jgi:peptidoglycan hydrolase-like protein with peptidoglycan-binding domain